MKLEKNSFTLFETLISIFLLTIIIINFSKISSYDNFDEEFMLLNSIENSFNSQDFSDDFSISNQQITILKNGTTEEFLSVKKITFSNEKITLSGYKLP